MSQKTLSEILIIIFLVVMGLIRFLPQLMIVLSTLELFLNKPFPAIISLMLSALYITCGIMIIFSTKVGFSLSIPVIIAQFLANCYMTMLTYGLWFLEYIIFMHILDLIVLAYLIYSLFTSKSKNRDKS
ncbi:MAG: hypothetical protein QXH19_03955 [Candidatus Bathyarchaeia archaeon]